MKQVTVFLFLFLGTTLAAYCNPGGWAQQIIDKISVSVSNNYSYYNNNHLYYSGPVYYVQPTTCRYQPRAVYFVGPPVRYMAPYQNIQGRRQ